MLFLVTFFRVRRSRPTRPKRHWDAGIPRLNGQESDEQVRTQGRTTHDAVSYYRGGTAVTVAEAPFLNAHFLTQSPVLPCAWVDYPGTVVRLLQFVRPGPAGLTARRHLFEFGQLG